MNFKNKNITKKLKKKNHKTKQNKTKKLKKKNQKKKKKKKFIYTHDNFSQTFL